MALKPRRKIQLCSICKGPIAITYWGWCGGHNAAPVTNGRCCDQCNDTVVIPARIVQALAKDTR